MKRSLLGSVFISRFEVICQNEGESFITGSKHRETDESTKPLRFEKAAVGRNKLNDILPEMCKAPAVVFVLLVHLLCLMPV